MVELYVFVRYSNLLALFLLGSITLHRVHRPGDMVLRKLQGTFIPPISTKKNAWVLHLYSCLDSHKICIRRY
ncbi:hypothetical protein BKA69DRAFT_256879 [Paraphysoderma sedebokerense]|nr:hypothetical protein BKA69DRAFT_256879 [Paraphysoderma sedebokerense]